MTANAADDSDVRVDIAELLGAVLSRWLRVVLVTLALLVATFVILMLMPRLYESSAGVLVEQRQNAFTGLSPQSSISAEALMSSQIELIRSRDTLLSVIDSENLRAVPEFADAGISPVSLVSRLIGRASEPRNIDQQVLSNLYDRLTVSRERDSAIISVSVLSEDPQLAARLANAIANAHVKRRGDLTLADTAEASGWLEQEITKLRARVQEAEAAVAQYRIRNDLFMGNNQTSLPDQQLSTISGQINAAQERRNSAASRAALIRRVLASGQSIEGVTDLRANPVIDQLVQNRADLQSELAQRSATLLDSHPTMQALRAQVAEMNAQIAAEARRMVTALEAEARVEGDVEGSLREDLARVKISASTATESTVELDALEREARAQRDLLESYLGRYREALSRTESNSILPDVRVITIAAPSVTPASPKTALTLGGVAFVAIMLQVGGILFGELMSGRALVGRSHETYVQPVYRDEPAAPDVARAALVKDAPARIATEPRAGTPRDTVAAAYPVASLAAHPAAAAAANELRRAEVGPRVAQTETPLRNLSADIAIGRARIVVLAGIEDEADCRKVSDRLAADATGRGLSVVTVDAGSGLVSNATGLADLAADQASFGDVVHKVHDGLAEVPWGTARKLERRSMKPVTLIEALSDLYDVVIVSTGRLSLASSLAIFSGVECRLVLVTRDIDDRLPIEAATEEAEALGFTGAQVVSPPETTEA